MGSGVLSSVVGWAGLGFREMWVARGGRRSLGACGVDGVSLRGAGTCSGEWRLWWLDFCCGSGLWLEWAAFLELAREQSRDNGGGREGRPGGVGTGPDATSFVNFDASEGLSGILCCSCSARSAVGPLVVGVRGKTGFDDGTKFRGASEVLGELDAALP